MTKIAKKSEIIYRSTPEIEQIRKLISNFGHIVFISVLRSREYFEDFEVCQKMVDAIVSYNTLNNTNLETNLSFEKLREAILSAHPQFQLHFVNYLVACDKEISRITEEAFLNKITDC